MRFRQRLGASRVARSLAALALATSFLAVGCIDDFSGKDDNGDDDDDDGPGGGGLFGATCTSLCEEGQDCPDAEPIDCPVYCNRLDRLSVQAGCGEQWDDYVACVGSVPDVCATSSDACDREGQAYIDCLLIYCDDHGEECDDALG